MRVIDQRVVNLDELQLEHGANGDKFEWNSARIGPKLGARDLGYSYEEGEGVQIRGWGGRKTQVELKVPTRNAGYDIGFARSNGCFDIVADWWGIREIKPAQFTETLTRRYAYHAVLDRLQEQGFALAQEETAKDGRVHLVLRRMA